MKKLIVAGSTGSIGKNVLEIARRNPERLKIKALCAGSNWELLAEQAKEFEPEVVALADEANYEKIKSALKATSIKVVAGAEGIEEAVTLKSADFFVAAIVGAAGLKPVIKAIENNKNVLLAK